MFKILCLVVSLIYFSIVYLISVPVVFSTRQRFCACAVVCMCDLTSRNDKPGSSFMKWECIYQHFWILLDLFHKTCWTKILKAITSLVIDGKGEPLLIQVWDNVFSDTIFLCFVIIRVEGKNQVSGKFQFLIVWL